MQQIKAVEFEDNEDGPCDRMIRKARKKLEEVGLADDQHSCDVILAFDAIKMRRCMILGTRKPAIAVFVFPLTRISLGSL
jgi:hypothetical protein